MFGPKSSWEIKQRLKFDNTSFGGKVWVICKSLLNLIIIILLLIIAFYSFKKAFI